MPAPLTYISDWQPAGSPSRLFHSRHRQDAQLTRFLQVSAKKALEMTLQSEDEGELGVESFFTDEGIAYRSGLDPIEE